ncbi:hypothetical protein [Gelria sp. Kuro-4]|uniref:hypothetical protein n=1 Tax=Gelria sp. Kuro-4 TaxID=2796927 RepID=UPI001BEFDA6C|nr:hypothetical protein [Gelria sp. Kuro-4]BCV24247.1 hypothetical protein kuro4_10200 [Gelria sp. Kuro-4]
MRLLVVEYESGLAQVSFGGLRKAGYAVDLAGDGGEALGEAIGQKRNFLIGYFRNF